MISAPYKLTATQVLELLKNNSITVEVYARSLLDRVKENESTVKAWAYLGKCGHSYQPTYQLREDIC